MYPATWKTPDLRVRPTGSASGGPEEPRYGPLAGPRSFRIYTPSLLLFSSVMSVSLILTYYVLLLVVGPSNLAIAGGDCSGFPALARRRAEAAAVHEPIRNGDADGNRRIGVDRRGPLW